MQWPRSHRSQDEKRGLSQHPDTIYRPSVYTAAHRHATVSGRSSGTRGKGAQQPGADARVRRMPQRSASPAVRAIVQLVLVGLALVLLIDPATPLVWS